jgi:molybdate transport system ATP-binding protein
VNLDVAVRLPLDRFELDVAWATEARVTGLFGPSGSGKTSLLEAIAGLRPAKGHVRVRGEGWSSEAPRPAHARDVGLVPQDALLFDHLDVRGNLLCGARRAERRGVPVGFDRVVALLELEDLLDRSVRALSGGEAKRVALGRALCSGPRLLLLDEPLGALDRPLRRRVLPLLRRVREELDVPMVVVSHDPVVMQALCDHMLVLDEGRVIARGWPSALIAGGAVDPGDRALENVVEVAVRGHGDGCMRTEVDGTELFVPRRTDEVGARLLVGIRASDILLAASEPGVLSARNRLPGRVLEVARAGRWRLVTVALGETLRLTSRVSEEAEAALGLAVGREVWCIFKAAAVVVYEAPR